MTSSAPVAHIEDSLKLSGDATADLWEITLKTLNTVVPFWNGPTTTWQGKEYNGLACQLQGEARSSDGKSARPTLTVHNPTNIFGPYASDGYFDLALVIRKRVLQTHLQSNTNLFEERVWICGRPILVSDQLLSLELRSPLDMPTWLTPRRTYSPPAYPFVVLN